MKTIGISLLLALGLGCNIPGIDDVEKDEKTTQIGPDVPQVQADVVIINDGGSVTYANENRKH